MSQDIYVNYQRVNGSTPINNTPIHVQLDNREVSEVLYYEGVAPIERFDAYVYGVYSILQTDILTDTKNIDPVTQKNAQYRVINISEPFPDFHMELIVDLLRQ